jgi:hypothetical protein
MTDGILTFLTLAVSVLGFALLTNYYRERRAYKIKLKPNCLLTRHPVVFVTGLRSLFYFRKYWNAYPEMLAEHGYEVFTLHLPWRGPTRLQRLQEFLQAAPESKKFHFVCDEATQWEFRAVFAQHPALASVTILKKDSTTAIPQSLALNLSYKLHTLSFLGTELPRPQDLGVGFPTESSLLLKRMQALGEQDFLT